MRFELNFLVVIFRVYLGITVNIKRENTREVDAQRRQIDDIHIRNKYFIQEESCVLLSHSFCLSLFPSHGIPSSGFRP